MDSSKPMKGSAHGHPMVAPSIDGMAAEALDDAKRAGRAMIKARTDASRTSFNQRYATPSTSDLSDFDLRQCWPKAPRTRLSMREFVAAHRGHAARGDRAT
jgi:hypothetical protein